MDCSSCERRGPDTINIAFLLSAFHDHYLHSFSIFFLYFDGLECRRNFATTPREMSVMRIAEGIKSELRTSGSNFRLLAWNKSAGNPPLSICKMHMSALMGVKGRLCRVHLWRSTPEQRPSPKRLPTLCTEGYIQRAASYRISCVFCIIYHPFALQPQQA